MEVFNDTGLAVGWISGKLRPPAFSRTIVVKGTFTLRHDTACELAAEEERLPLEGDRHVEQDLAKGLDYDSDFALWKPEADVLFTGTAYPAVGVAGPVCNVALEVGSLRKELAIFGDRFWTREVGEGWLGDDAAMPSSPRPFTSMRLDYRRSFGGPGFSANPVGRGAPQAEAPPTSLRPLPNVEDPKQLLVSPDQTPAPAGFGPLDRRWAPRATTRLGTYDEAWRRQRWPALPEDFDFRYFQAAPPDQRVAGYLRGDERIVLTKLHPTIPRLAARLPGLRVRCFARAEEAIREIPLHLDTLWIDGDGERVILVWRGSIDTASRLHRELSALLLVTEPLAEPRVVDKVYQQPHFWCREPEDDASPEEAVAPAPPPANDDADDAEVAEQLAKVREILRGANLSPELLARLDRATRPDQLLHILTEAMPDDPGALERAQRDSRERMRALFAAHGHDPSLLDELDEVEAEEAALTLTREQAFERAARRASFAGCVMRDLDLRGIDLHELDLQKADLRGADLRGANLAGVDLSEARLAGCDLRGATLAQAIAPGAELSDAQLEEADLSGADLSGAKLRGCRMTKVQLRDADLSEADLSRAHLEEAVLDEAELSGARLDEAILAGASCVRTRFVGASLVGADLEAANLEGADLSQAELRGARLRRASLREASLYGASGDDAVLTGAELGGARLSEGASFARASFEDARGAKVTFMNAQLRGASFRNAVLERADFSEADLEGASLHRAILKHASFEGASLRGAALTQVNLFCGSLGEANLEGADCRGSSFYGVDLAGAQLSRAKLEGTNLKATKLAPGPTS